MIKEIVQYPAPLSLKHSTDVRSFDDDLFSLIDDLKDTMKENNLDGLAAYQIGDYHNVIVVKTPEGEILEMMNPRLIAHKGEIVTKESTAYYPQRTAEITRFEDVSVVYQGRDGKDLHLKASGEFAVLLQRKIDYTFGATFIHKMSPEQKDLFERGLEFGADIAPADYCPTVFQRDKIIKLINIMLIIMLLNTIGSFLVSEKSLLSSMWEYQLYASYGVVFLNIVYFFYAQYEGKKYVACSSCQIGNIIGTTVISLIKLTLIMAVSYFFINPL
jgi:peptide deformylase